MNPFRLRRQGPHIVIQRQVWQRLQLRWDWQTIATLDRVWAANLAAELDAWLAGTDALPEVQP
jgi:hypothetical protein